MLYAYKESSRRFNFLSFKTAAKSKIDRRKDSIRLHETFPLPANKSSSFKLISSRNSVLTFHMVTSKAVKKFAFFPLLNVHSQPKPYVNTKSYPPPISAPPDTHHKIENVQFIQNLLMGCQLDCLFSRWKTCYAPLLLDSSERARGGCCLRSTYLHPFLSLRVPFPFWEGEQKHENRFLCRKKKLKTLNSPKLLRGSKKVSTIVLSAKTWKTGRQTGRASANKIHVPSSSFPPHTGLEMRLSRDHDCLNKTLPPDGTKFSLLGICYRRIIYIGREETITCMCQKLQ